MSKFFMQRQSFQLYLLASLLFLVSACTAETPTSSTSSAPTTAASAQERVETDTEEIFSLGGMPKNSAGYVDLTVDQLATAMSDKDFTLVNVHVPDQGNLPMTDLSIAYNDVDAFVAALPDKDVPIVIYCRSGGMSSQMAPALAELGYTNLFELKGGYNAWSAAGHELLPPQ